MKPRGISTVERGILRANQQIAGVRIRPFSDAAGELPLIHTFFTV